MRVLGIDTSTAQSSVGLLRASEALGEVLFPSVSSRGEQLLPAVETLLRTCGVRAGDLELIAVATGPGSFTGLRIGLAAAKGLAQALQRPLVGVPTADTYVSRLRLGSWAGWIGVLLPDRRDLVYRVLFDEEGQRRLPEASLPLDRALEEFFGREEPTRLLLTGPGVEHHRKALQKALIEGKAKPLELAPPGLNRPAGLEVARLGLAKFQKTCQDELFALEPLYVQRPLAELEAGRRSSPT